MVVLDASRYSQHSYVLCVLPARMRLISLQFIQAIIIATSIAVPLEDLLSQHLAPERTYSLDATCGNGYSCNPNIALGGKCCAEDNTCGK